MSNGEETEPTPEQKRQDYINYIKQFPGYQTILEKTRQNYTPKGAIRSPVHLPRWTDDEFLAQREKYQAKYGSRINPPEFQDIFQWNIPPTISTEEYALHKYAQARGMPSPLNQDQLKYLKYKKQQFLKMLQSPEPAWMQDIGQIITSIDAAEQALNSVYVIGRIALHFAPELLKGIVKPLGWVALSYDILNLFDVYTQIGTAKYAKKRLMDTIHEKNPFSERAWARRASTLNKTWPTLGEFIQLAHTADHMFGVGLCLGQTMAFINDTTAAGMDQILEFGANVGATIVWPQGAEYYWNDALKTGAALWASKDVWEIALPETLGAMSDMAAKAITPLWLHNKALVAYPRMDKKRWHYPKPKNPLTLDNLLESGHTPAEFPVWPGTDESAITTDQMTDLYAAKIKDNFQTYSLINKNSVEGWMLGQHITSFNNTMIQFFSDDTQVQIASTASVKAAKNMAIAGLNIGPGSPPDAMQKLGEYINQYEIENGDAPSVKEIKYQGDQIGIQWSGPPAVKTSAKAEELFPGWNAIQDQLEEIYTPDD